MNNFDGSVWTRWGSKPTHTCSLVLLLQMLLFLNSGRLPCRTEQDVSLPCNELLHKGAVLPYTPATQKNTQVQHRLFSKSSHVTLSIGSWNPARETVELLQTISTEFTGDTTFHGPSSGTKFKIWKTNIFILEPQAATANNKGSDCEHLWQLHYQ